jgi:hypothetical protein
MRRVRMERIFTGEPMLFKLPSLDTLLPMYATQSPKTSSAVSLIHRGLQRAPYRLLTLYNRAQQTGTT